MKRTVNIAYWDTEQGAPTPQIFGQIKGTPTIKFIVPHKKNKKGKFKKKRVSDYNGERKHPALKEYAESQMPSAVETINGMQAMEKFLSKADKYGLPQALVFLKASSSMATVKALSIEHRRKLLIGVVKGTKNNQDVMDKYGVKELPSALVLPLNTEEPVLYTKKPSFNGLNFFFGKHALSQPVYGSNNDEEKEKAPKTEL